MEHLSTALLVARSRVNCGIGYSPFEMVYGFKPQVVQSDMGLKLIVPSKVLKITLVLQEIRARAEKFEVKKLSAQGIAA